MSFLVPAFSYGTLPNLCRNCGEEYRATVVDYSPETGDCWEPILCPACIKDERLDEVSA